VEANRLSVLSDEVAPDLRGAIQFAKAFELKWLELRGQESNKRNYYHAPLAEVRESAKILSDAGIGVSFLNTRFLKWHYPGTEKDAIPFPELFDAYKRYNPVAAEASRRSRKRVAWQHRTGTHLGND
jgi:hypothetical protein